jgi:adenylate cyclase
VIARNSSFTYKGRSVDMKLVGRELGVRYVLEGSVRRAGNRVRITGQLIDATSDAHLWADRFDGSLEDVFELQEKVAVSVAGVIEPALQAAEIRRSVERPTKDLTAYDLYLRALSHALTWGKQGVIQALDLLGKAIERDPNYGPALALAARCHQDLYGNGWCEEPEANRREGMELARRALLGAGDDPSVLGNSAYVIAYFGEDIKCLHRAGRQSPGPQPEFRARLGDKRVAQAVVGPARYRHHPFRDVATAQPTVRRSVGDHGDRRRPFLRPPFRGGQSDAAAIVATESRLGTDASLSGFMLCPHGTPR